MSEGVNVPVTITVDGTDQANSDLGTMSANWDKVGLSGFQAARSLTNGLGGLLSAQQNVYNAQQRLNVANISYILTVREYGSGSIQAQKALDQLKQAQEGVTVSQDQLSLRMIQFAVTTGPQVYLAITKMAAAATGMTVANYEETASWYAKAAAIGLTLGILTAGLAIFGGLLSGAAASAQVSTAQQSAPVTINQSNNFQRAPSRGAMGAANAQLVASVRNTVRP